MGLNIYSLKGDVMRFIVALPTVVATLLGIRLGYSAAGIGGAIVFAAIIGIGGLLIGRFLAQTVRLLRWPEMAALTVLLLIAILGWDVRL